VRILLTNDDGIDAPGLHALYHAIEGLGDVSVVAPAEVQSATSHAVTFHRPIRVTPYRGPFEGHAVDGRPADCVKLAIAALLDRTPDLVISGMNAGANVGVNVLYSGTVGAAREATFDGIPAVAVSLHLRDRTQSHWDRAADHARRAIDLALETGIDRHTAVNINVPVLDGGAEPVGMSYAPLCTSPMVCRYDATRDGDATLYRIADTMEFARPTPGSDVDLLFRRHVTLTAMHFELTYSPAG